MPSQDRDTQKPMDADDLKNALCKSLDNVEGGGSFATSGFYSEAPLPGLSLEGYGSIPLPLAERDVEAICKERVEGDVGKECNEMLEIQN